MKRYALAVLACAAAGTAGAQQAGSNVVLGGVVDASARSTQNSLGTLRSLSSGNNSTSRIVFRGNEDLGDGLSAGFWLETSIFVDTGTTGGLAVTPANQFFDRTAIVRLTSSKWGEIRLGREWNPVFLGWVYSDPFIAVGVGSAANFFTSGVTTALARAFGNAAQPSTISRTSNAVQYWTPAGLGGAYGQLMVAPSEGGNAQGSFRYNSARAGWKNAQFDASLYIGTTRIDAADTSLKQIGAYAAYDFGIARLAASLTESSYLSSKQRNIIVGLNVPIGVHLVRASFNRADQRGTDAAGSSIDANDANQFALGYQYSLSRRTALYTQAAKIVNHGNARFAVPGGPATGMIGAGSSSTGYEAGIRHSF